MKELKGSVRKRGNTFQYRFYVRDQLTNERTEVSKGGFETEKEAEKALKKALAEVELGIFKPGKKVTFKQLTELWLESKQESVRESTMYSYKRAIFAQISPIFDRLDIKDIKPLHIHNFYQKLKKDGLSKRYISYVGTIVGSILKKGVQMELIQDNPVKNVDKPKMAKNKQKSWSAEQAIEFLRVAKFRASYYLAYFLSFNTGMRIGEVLGLHWSDINFDTKIIHIQHSLTLVEGDYIIGPPKTESSDRFIPIGDNLIRELQEHKKFSKNTSEDLVFKTKNGKIVDPYTVRYMMRKISDELDLPHIRFHDIRRTHTSILIDEGVSPKVVSQRLGHSDVSFTLNIYTDVFDERQVEASKKIDEILNADKFAVKEENEDDKIP